MQRRGCRHWGNGLTGHWCREENVVYGLPAVERALREVGIVIPEGIGIQRACARLEMG